MTTLNQYLHSYFHFQQEELEKVAKFFKRQEINKGEFLLKQGQYCRRLSFVDEGLVRIYALKDGKEVTQWISTSGYFIMDINSFLFGEPARWNIQALTDTTLFSISQSDYVNLGETVRGWERLEKQFMAKCFVMLENRVFNLISLTAEERYDQLFAENKELFNKVPLQYLASMLGMSPETLSRIRKKKLS